jgi:hypothetical protein
MISLGKEIVEEKTIVAYCEQEVKTDGSLDDLGNGYIDKS